MKVSRVDLGLFSATNRSNQNKKADLTSFGVNSADTKNSSQVFRNNALANIALSSKSSAASGIAFKGHTESLSFISLGTAGYRIKITDDYMLKPFEEMIPMSEFGNYDFKDYLIKAIKSTGSAFPNSSVALSKKEPRKQSHDKRENFDAEYRDKLVKYATSIYYADPEEFITDSIERSHYYIVYDNRPKWPSLDRVYRVYHSRQPLDDDLSQWFQTIFDYHERLENVDRPVLFKFRQQQKISGQDKRDKIEYYDGRLKDSLRQQRLSKQAGEIFSEAKRLIDKKNEDITRIETYEFNQECWNPENGHDIPEDEYERRVNVKRKELEMYKKERETATNAKRIEWLDNEIYADEDIISLFEEEYHFSLLPKLRQEVPDIMWRLGELYPKMEEFYRRNIQHGGFELC